jgi:hypothetical protein
MKVRRSFSNVQKWELALIGEYCVSAVYDISPRHKQVGIGMGGGGDVRKLLFVEFGIKVV